MGDSHNYLHLARPLAPAPIATSQSSVTAPVSVTLQPQALFSIIDHASRRPADQERVIGTLLGTRSEDGTEVSVTNCYAVPHTETAEQVEMDMDYQKRMLDLHLRAAPKEVLNFYSQQGEGTFPHPAVHLTVSTVAGQDVEANTYISAPIGVTAERAADSCLFIPVPHEIKYDEASKSGLELIAGARDRDDRTQLMQTDLETLERAIEQVLEMLERVSNYVSDVLDEEQQSSTALGQFLLNTLALAPKVDAEDIERDFNNHIQDVLLVSYLANTIRTQIDLSNRLATAAITMGGDTNVASSGGDQQKQQSGERGGERGGQRREGGGGQQQRSGQAGPGGRRGEQ
ncbi:hypothetical protein LTR91_000286 [Friedmanniomyces endolithicus]|uniref:MPN domain-containing protein n=1 Tax=Friedmanniomyces endolithicus TaxID=329885 RepID=A0AAN6J5M9_9PEZI|nr:hypothetical protein LTS00_006139 [Friedmanniomyces endolithicus]KAK0317362.1 hypothetical protein LTR82_011685 [Friedmanniomyces endolithicus]KAK0931336.1 hypothetical protein LTR57_000751 [Friedmanniomyces endolithicus]KAK1016266.1 hypothetical protein LTR91_000286 [Friedmanniomyces endolithicus]KAK1054661.1 hypothetical protein LTS16_000306 [Friedmanniomyces endolithicus]